MPTLADAARIAGHPRPGPRRTTHRRTVMRLAGPGIRAARELYTSVPADAVRVAALVEISAAAAALARTVVKLRHLDAWTEARRSAARFYDEALAGNAVRTPKARTDVRHVYHIYAIRTPDRAGWQKALTERGIQSGIHYPIPVHLQPAYADPRWKEGDFPHSELAAKEVLSLPMFPELQTDQQRAVIDAVLDLARA